MGILKLEGMQLEQLIKARIPESSLESLISQVMEWGLLKNILPGGCDNSGANCRPRLKIYWFRIWNNSMFPHRAKKRGICHLASSVITASLFVVIFSFKSGPCGNIFFYQYWLAFGWKKVFFTAMSLKWKTKFIAEELPPWELWLLDS